MKKIYINPGHSDKDPGAVGYETERRLNVAVSKHMNDYLLANFECETKMNPGTMDSLTAICNDANSWGADLFVSIHFNAGGGDGYEALVYSQKRVPLGEIFAKQVKAIGQNLRQYGAAPGVKIRTDLAVLAKTNMPAVLNEGAFVDNQKDIQDWNDDAELKKLGEAYAKAAAEFLGLKEKVQPKSVYYVHYSTNIGPFDKQTADNLLAGLKAAGYTDVGITESKE
jgi:N-acetylmuramoyl-L-alanine amidase